MLWIRKHSFGQDSADGRPINYGSGQSGFGSYQDIGTVVNIIKYGHFIIFDKQEGSESGSGGQIITDPTDPDPQHCKIG